MLQQAVYYHLDNNSLDNALFFAERLGAQDKTAEATFLLALCHFRLGDDRTAYHFSKAAGYRGIHLGCSYVFAQACLRLELWKDGIAALEKSRGLWSPRNNMGKHTAGLRMPHPDSAACSCLLGKLYRGYDDKTRAVACFEESLKVNPLMWDAFTTLCDMGVTVRVPNIFKSNDMLIKNFDQVANSPAHDHKEPSSNALEPLHVPKKSSRSAAQDPADPFDSSRTTGSNDIVSFSNLQDDGNDFMSKIVAARSRNGNATGPSPNLEGVMETPTGYAVGAEAQAPRVVTGPEPPHAPMRRTRPLQTADQEAPPRVAYKLQSKRRAQVQDAAEAPSDPAPSLLKSSSITERKRTVSGQPVHSRPMHTDEPGAPQRRSARLNVFNKSTTKTNSGASTVGVTAGRELKRARAPISNRFVRSNASVGRVVSGNRRGTEDVANMDVDRQEGPTAKAPVAAQRMPQKPPDPEPVGTEEALKLILDLLRRYGYGYQQLSQFDCQDALQSFSTLPRQHQDTPWVLAHMGRAQYEQAAYPEAERYFRRLRIMSPTRMQDMEVYSTILWHLKRETDLSFLAHELIDSAWLSPEAWCALGNAWSLAKDHEQALRCFKRATQLAPKFAYAYTLQGHEHMANEEYDKALTTFRLSILADRRHYNAWYGIGMVYEKLGNYDKAYIHFQAASQIHPTNAVLICCIGTVLEKQKQIKQALAFFSKATELAPRAAQARFRKARALLAIGHLPKAQNELLILKSLAPDDARVHFLLGKLYKAQNDKSQAVRHFTQALSLDPKASQQIKEAIESLEDDDGLDDSMVQ
ncbi:TPR-like protein [Cryphonectria parasitica EP155]|uniref:TPR-like protein n=1 Tax=Cryphonectria parasitica (strain ATCC 38755 / EP155) TaxID=660469 RepID=A0A9P4YAX3_CRYP1|nr:TPR-like protein [Cryphonectria parasitica EP155]KAF3770244.1 TPR-like protein [Cryphonectria parasitica EP155]